MPKPFLIYIIIFFTSCTYNRFKTEYFDFYKGDIPIILIVSHDGKNEFNFLPIRKDSTRNFNIKNDLNTKSIGQNIYNEIFNSFNQKPTLIINNIHRKYVDLNREPKYAYESYRGKIIHHNYHYKINREVQRLIQKYNKVFIFDIHGFAHNEIDIVLSTRNHKTIMKSDRDFFFTSKNSIYKNLVNTGFKVQINKPFYGGYTIKNIKEKNKDKNISLIQLELGNEIRFNKSIENKFINLFSTMIFKLVEDQVTP